MRRLTLVTSFKRFIVVPHFPVLYTCSVVPAFQSRFVCKYTKTVLVEIRSKLLLSFEV